MPESGSSGSAARIRDVFSRALEISSGPDREQFLDSACRSDSVLREEVESLLQSHVEAETFLDTSASGRAIASQEGIIGTQIGRYRIIESIGEGGFGEVYRAEQTEPLRREVALKIIKPGMDSREVIARFESERQALALMDHPNIAHVFDAGTTEGGRLYFVMELVCGVPITTYCDDHQLELPVRLKLFQQVCGAVQHAHQKGIIHRDLKPSNIVVVEQDGSPVPKIIDFGIAKSLQGRLSDRIPVTQREVFIGTPAYMSPEQIDLASDQLDTRTDIYSLGVLLYELIAGVQPFENDTLQRVALVEVQRIIREEEPSRPSRRLNTLGETAKGIAKHRSINLSSLERALRGDLDWIVMKAIEKDRDRRYQVVGDLAQDVDRHLEQRPVEAGPPSQAYRARKFVRRHSIGVAFTTAMALTMVFGLVFSIVGFARAQRERDRAQVAELLAEVEAAKATTIRHLIMPTSDAMLDTLPSHLFFRRASENTDATRAVTEALDALRMRVENRLTTQPEVEIVARKALADSYVSLGQSEDAIEQLERLTEISREIHGLHDIQYADSLVDYATSLAQEVSIDNNVVTGYRFRWQEVNQYTLQYELILADRAMCEALDIYRAKRHLSVRYLSALQYSVSRLDIGLRAPMNLELEEATERFYGPESLPEQVFERLEPDTQSWFQGEINGQRMMWESIHPAFGAIREESGEPATNGLRRLGQIHEKVGHFEQAEAIYRRGVNLAEESEEVSVRDYLENIRSLTALLNRMGKSDPAIEGKLAEAAFANLFDPSHCIVEYRMNIETPGTYQLYLRWEGYNQGSDRISVRIKELRDGPGGTIADAYGFTRAPLYLDAEFLTFLTPQFGYFEEIEPVAQEDRPPTWEIFEPGIYTLQFIGVETGIALDLFIFQLEEQTPATILYPPDRTIQNPDGSYTEQEGQIVVEAEHYSSRTSGQSTEWVVIPTEAESTVDFQNFQGEGYLQVLPDPDPVDPVALLRSRAWTRERLGRWEDAIEFYNDAIERYPDLYEFRLKRGLAYDELENYERAASDYRVAIDLADNPEEARILRADCLLSLGRAQEVISELSPIVPSSTQNMLLVDQLVQALTTEGREEEALHVLSEAIERQPYNASHRSNRGNFYANLGKYRIAKEDFIRAIELDPNQIWRFRPIISIYLLGGYMDRAEFEDLIQKMPIPSGSIPSMSHARFLFTLSAGPDLAPDVDALISVADFILETLPPDHSWGGPIRAQLAGAAYFRAGKYERAEKLLLRAQESSTRSWGPRNHYTFLLAMTCFQLGQIENAVQWYDRAVEELEEEDHDLTDSHEGWDSIEIQLLRREAAAMLGIPHSGMTEGLLGVD